MTTKFSPQMTMTTRALAQSARPMPEGEDAVAADMGAFRGW